MREIPSAWTASYAPCPPPYRRRDPEATVLHGVLREHLEPLLARLQDAGHPLPRFVVRELRAFLRCGVLAYGFCRWRCPECGKSLLVAFSCGGRAVCPSCCGRRMAQTAANLVDHVLPEAPFRQWVLTLPFSLRFLVAFHHDLELELLRVFVHAVSAWYRARARAQGARDPQTGGVAFLQRFQDDLALNPHFHALFLEGCYDAAGPAPPAFAESPPPGDADVAWVAARVARGVRRVLARRGLADQEARDAAAREAQEEEPVLAALASASVRGTHALDGRRVARLRADSPPAARLRGRLCAEAEGCNLHAGTYVPAFARRRLEDLIRYLARPPLGDDRLALLPDGQVAVRLKRQKPDGTTAIILPPDELICRLAALVPRPFKNGLVYFGVFSGNADLRAAVVPGGRQHECGGGKDRGRIPWADLLLRAFGIDVRQCDCGARFELIAEIHDPEVIRAILASMGLPVDPLPITPARPPPDNAWDWAA